MIDLDKLKEISESELAWMIRRGTTTVLIEILIAECAKDYDVEPEKILHELKANKRPFVGSMKIINNLINTLDDMGVVKREHVFIVIEDVVKARGWEAYKDENRYKGDVR